MTRVLAFDPGATTGWAVVEVERAREPARLGAFGVLRAVPPRAAREDVESVIAEAGPDLVVVECTIGEAFGRGGGRRGNVSDLVACARLDGMIVGWAGAAGLVVLEVPAASWRHALCQKPGPTTQEIARALQFKVANPPPPMRSNEHERDAMGLAVVAAQAWLAAREASPLFKVAELREERRKVRAHARAVARRRAPRRVA